MRPVTRRDTQTRNPVHRSTTVGAVKDESAEFSFEIGLYVEEFEAKHLRLERDRM